MPTFRVVDFHNASGEKYWESDLNDMAKEGWVLITVVPMATYTRIIFMQEPSYE